MRVNFRKYVAFMNIHRLCLDAEHKSTVCVIERTPSCLLPAAGDHSIDVTGASQTELSVTITFDENEKGKLLCDLR